MSSAEGHLAASEQSLQAARILLDAGLERDAASRAYYSLFHAALAILDARGIHPRTHGGTAEALRLQVSQGGVTEDDFRLYLEAMDLRSAADYEAMRPVPTVRLNSLVAAAGRFLERARRLASSGPVGAGQGG